MADGLADGAPEKNGEDGVFREMAAFANDVVNGFNLVGAHMRNQYKFIDDWDLSCQF